MKKIVSSETRNSHVPMHADAKAETGGPAAFFSLSQNNPATSTAISYRSWNQELWPDCTD
jgi:hypothetical protein